jgi:RNA polymerase sporulation-specific sigma factor
MIFNKLLSLLKKNGIFNEFNDEIVNFICSGEALPSPLKEDEETKILNEINQNINVDDNRAILIEHNIRLVVYITKKFENTNVDTDDLISIGSIGLIKAVKSYKIDKNIKLATYASRCIENEILMYLRKIVKQKAEVSLDEPINVDYDGNELLLEDLICAEEQTSSDIEKSQEKKLLFHAMEKLNDTEKNIMMMRFGLCGQREFTQKEVADSLGISQSYISRLEKKIFARLKKDINKMTNF